MIASYIFIYSIAVYAIASAIVYFDGPFDIISKVRDKLSRKSKSLEKLFSCMFCLPFNIGIVLSIIAILANFSFTPFTAFFHNRENMWFLSIIMDGAYAAGITYLIDSLQIKLDNHE